MPVIAWSEFSWEAFATLAAGAMAVGAAIWVGRRQLKIADRQTEILGQQAAIAGLAVRTELFDRRMEVYEASWDLLMEIVRHAAEPPREAEQRFLRAKADAKMLFSAEIGAYLQAFWEDVIHFSAAHKECRRHYDRHGHYGPSLDAEHKRMDSLTARVDSMPEAFAKEMGFGGNF